MSSNEFCSHCILVRISQNATYNDLMTGIK